MDMNSLHDAVYGNDYEAAVTSMQLLQQSITQQEDIGFQSKEELEQWAHENLLDNVVFSNSQHRFYNVSHKGELITPQTFLEYYENILYYYAPQVNGTMKPVKWFPKGYKYFNNAKLPGEASDGTHNPMYYRDYTRPTGYFNPAKGAYNSAKPFPVFAQETGRDTSFIYTYINAVAGICAPWLLLWLKTKMLYPTQKTQVVPIIVSRTQGTGKSTFGEVICKGLFGQDNVLVTDQYDATARFNSDYADALVVCQEEKEETDRKNPVATLKSRATATMIRKELKGIDPIYQESYTEFVITTNKDVPVKFDSPDDQRRFMVMEADSTFTSHNEQAKEIFEKLYGYSSTGEKIGVPFVDDYDLIRQFKHELFQWDETVNGEKISLRKFPHTAAYEKCYAIPRTTESVEIESIMRSLIPFIKESLVQKQDVTSIPNIGEISNIVQYLGAVEYFPEIQGKKAFVALCRPLVFYDMQSNKPYSHAVVDKSLLNLLALFKEHGIQLMSDTSPVPGGFTKIQGRHKEAVAAKFCLLDDSSNSNGSFNISSGISLKRASSDTAIKEERKGTCLRVNNFFVYDLNGCYETVNEMKEGITSLRGSKSQNVQYMDTFLFESDDCTKNQYDIEKKRANEWKYNNNDKPIDSTFLYKERLLVQEKEALRLFNEGKVCRIVYSGGKSYHLLVRIKDAPTTLEEYSWLHAYISSILSDTLTFDAVTSDPARLTRSPLTMTRMSKAYDISVQGTQQLVAQNYSHIYNLSWRELYQQWLNRPRKHYEKHRRLLPTKQIYKDAVEALLSGTYWSNSVFDGIRQETFFPAYRLLRSLGYSHEDLWSGDENILRGLEQYSKQNETLYWKTREHCALITQIDTDFDNKETVDDE